MARRPRNSKLEVRSDRLKLAVRRKPHEFTTVSPGISLGYRRNKGPGVWVVRCADGNGANWTKAIAAADDHEDSNGDSVLNFWEAQERARALARGDTASSTRPITVDEALVAYRENLVALGGAPMNAHRAR